MFQSYLYKFKIYIWARTRKKNQLPHEFQGRRWCSTRTQNMAGTVAFWARFFG